MQYNLNCAESAVKSQSTNQAAFIHNNPGELAPEKILSIVLIFVGSNWFIYNAPYGPGAVMLPDAFVDYNLCVCLFVCLFVYFPFFLPYFLLSLYFLPYLFNSLLVYFVTYLPTSRIDPFCFQARCRRRRPNLASFFGFILFCGIFCYRCMFAFIVF